MLVSGKGEPYHIGRAKGLTRMTENIEKGMPGKAGQSVAEIHAFWFGQLDDRGLCTTDRGALWFGADEQTDAACRLRFAGPLQLALAGKLDAWTQTDAGLIALVVLLDQFSRNIHRGALQAFAGDPQALALAQDAIASGRHLLLPAIHRIFLYLPLQHCENLAVQEESVALNEELAQLTGNAQFANFARYAVAHRDVIARFGRFPHRNAILGRTSTQPELAYLAEHGGF
jgi:uncharacterized protein (DUF924 family)